MNTIEYLCGCKYPTHGVNAYYDHHCATCHRELWSQSLVDSLKAKLQGWHFEPYGKEGAIACFPPPPKSHGVRADAYRELSAIAPIESVCGPFYVVTQLRNQAKL